MRHLIAAGILAVSFAGGVGLATHNGSSPAPHVPSEAKACNDWPGTYTDGECFAAGTIQYSLHDLQGAAQFCKWRAANPGEWSRLKGYASTAVAPSSVITWLGGSIRHQLEAYFAAGAPPFTIPPNTAPNVCKTPLAPPVVQGVTPSQTDVTVTVES